MRTFPPIPRAAWAALLALALAPAAARASDGRTPLYQGQPIYSPGTYYLTQDVVSSANPIFEIWANGVTIDLNGHTLQGTGLNDAIRQPNGAAAGVRVTNGRIDNCRKGVELQGPGPNVVDHVVFTNCINYNIHIFYATAGGEVSHNTILMPASAGTSGISVTNSVSFRVVDNTVAGGATGGAWGINLDYDNQCELSGNRVSGTGGNALSMSYSRNCRIADNVLSGSGGHGINIVASHYNTFQGNAACGNAYNGIYLSTGVANTFDWNTASSNGQAGLSINDNNNEYSFNRTRNDAGGGIYIGASSSGNTNGGGNY